MFLHFCHTLNSLGLSVIAAFLRRCVSLFLVSLTIRYYQNPEQVGYAGWIESPRVGVLAFIRADHTVQWRW